MEEILGASNPATNYPWLNVDEHYWKSIELDTESSYLAIICIPFDCIRQLPICYEHF